MLQSSEVEVPRVVGELVRFVPFFSPVPAGMFDADFGQGFNPLEVDVDTCLLSSNVWKLGWCFPFYGQCLHRVESEYFAAFCSSEA